MIVIYEYNGNKLIFGNKKALEWHLSLNESQSFERGKDIREVILPWNPGKLLISKNSFNLFNIWMYSGKEGIYNEMWDIGRIRKKRFRMGFP
ncbi:MAG: hypothetical protein M0R03_20415 [Novosphingobium sp.]|nr:hypothetical protein [Novosphingobium sp.]